MVLKVVDAQIGGASLDWMTNPRKTANALHGVIQQLIGCVWLCETPLYLRVLKEYLSSPASLGVKCRDGRFSRGITASLTWRESRDWSCCGRWMVCTMVGSLSGSLFARSRARLGLRVPAVDLTDRRSVARVGLSRDALRPDLRLAPTLRRLDTMTTTTRARRTSAPLLG